MPTFTRWPHTLVYHSLSRRMLAQISCKFLEVSGRLQVVYWPWAIGRAPSVLCSRQWSGRGFPTGRSLHLLKPVSLGSHRHGRSFPTKLMRHMPTFFSRSAALICLVIFEVCWYRMSEEDKKAPRQTTLKSFGEDPKPQLPTKFKYVGDMKVSPKGGFFVLRHVDQSEERSHGRVHLSQSRCWRG